MAPLEHTPGSQFIARTFCDFVRARPTSSLTLVILENCTVQRHQEFRECGFDAIPVGN